MTASKIFTSRNVLLNSLIVLVAAFVIYQLYVFIVPARTAPDPLLPLGGFQQEAAAGERASRIVQIDVLNGCGAQGAGVTLTTFLRSQGYDVVEMGNYKSFDVKETLVIDRTGNLAVARTLGTLLGIRQNNVIQQISPDYLVTASVVIGKDFKHLAAWKNSR
ncbi:MAG: LytR C-terminal domain-containing protein [Bacteroidota bacterium]|nr:LytR C-terminal domain-containing protein [Bacteroidota bacterium]